MHLHPLLLLVDLASLLALNSSLVLAPMMVNVLAVAVASGQVNAQVPSSPKSAMADVGLATPPPMITLRVFFEAKPPLLLPLLLPP